MKSIFGVILFICLSFLNLAQTSFSIFNNSEAYSDYNYTDDLDNSDIKSPINKVDENIIKKINLFLGIGYTPFKLNSGIGYFIFRNTEINIQYSSMFIPLTLDVDVYSLGLRFYEDNSSAIYSISCGGAIPRQNRKAPIGLCLEGSLGYLIQTEVGFYFLPSFKAGYLLRKQENSYGIIGIDLSLGWFIK